MQASRGPLPTIVRYPSGAAEITFVQSRNHLYIPPLGGPAGRMIIAQISDLHVMPRGKLAYGRVDTAAMLAEAVAHVNRLRPVPDIILVSGDLADHGDSDAYAQCRALLADLPAPFFVIPGNHDRTDTFRAAFADHAYLPERSEFFQYAIEDFPVRLVAIDSRLPGEVRGRLCADRLGWLDDTLGRRPNAPTILMMHHAPFRTGLRHFDAVSLEEPEALEAIVRRHKQIERIVCGHVHRATQIRFGGTIASSCPATAHQLTLDLRADTEESFCLEPPGFQVHRWNGERLYSYTVTVGEFDGPYPFHTPGEDA